MSEWWRGATLYQIYPRSFADSNGDGVGDLRGIINKLDHVADLKVDGVWVSPFFTSPMRDFGYDVADYTGVDPLFGTLDDFKELVTAAHARDLKLIIDLVLSHTSIEHPWFQESRQSRDNEKADWYVWADPAADGGPPSNWQSVFVGPAWTWDARRKQYYLHNFLKEQPDLNVRNADVQDALLDVMRFWLDLGVDGFRLDALNFYMHHPEFHDNPPASNTEGAVRPFDFQRRLYNRSHPDIHGFLKKARSLADGYGDRFLLAEIGDQSSEFEAIDYTGEGDRVHSAYSFVFIENDDLKPETIREAFAPWLARNAWPTWTFSNHDAPRSVSRWKREGDVAAAAQLNALLIALQGTIIFYQGEELGLPQADVPFDRLQDPEGIENWPETKGRDGARTPIAWAQKAKHGGFSDTCGDPWLPVDDRHLALAVDVQKNQQDSILARTKALIALRQKHDVLRHGIISLPPTEHSDVLVIIRVHEGQVLNAFFNFGEEAREIMFGGTVIASQNYRKGLLEKNGFVFYLR